MDYVFRNMREEDRESILGIFNFFVENSFAAFPEEKVGTAFFSRLVELARGFPFYVIDSTDGVTIGFGLARRYQASRVFSPAAELTYFILPEHTGKGLGARLLESLIRECRARDLETVVASVSSVNEQSLHFHEKNGFRERGRLERVGRKFGRAFDVVLMQRFI